MSRGRNVEVVGYLPIPPSRSREFWTKWKIQHIRLLATTGHATDELTIPDTERTARVLDKLYLKESPLPSGHDSARTSVQFARGSRLTLSVPLYLGDMSFGALSGIPNIAIARAADKTKILAGTGEGGLREADVRDKSEKAPGHRRQ